VTEYVGPLLPSYVSIGSLILTAREASGVVWIMEDILGWGPTKGTLAPTQRARGAGATGTSSFPEMGTMTLHGWVTATNPAGLQDALDRLSTAFPLTAAKMTVTESGVSRWTTVQRVGAIDPVRHGDSAAQWSVQVVALDPLRYGDAITVTTGLPSTTGGRTRPSTWPVTWSGVTNTGQLTITNPGNEPAPVYLTINGSIPAGGWSVNHIGQNMSLSFATSLALASTEFVTVDMQKHEVLAQGQSPRNGWVTSRGWFQLNPGLNVIAFSAAVYDPTATLTILTYPAWS